MCFDYEKKLARTPDYHQTHTTILEFSRGSEHGGYHAAYQHLSQEVVEHMAILYLDVSYSESLRKNRARFNPDKPDSILEHSLPDAKLERMYKEVDWHDLVRDDTAYITIQGVKVPYVVFENEDDVTTARGDALGDRLEARLQTLWQRWNDR
jgi:hypothetical protein